ncbi:unnamed protein product [Bursaphelenchus xylophilus]|uniref:(pine wood nematode) hypothetical protein n=1 Tax=Bursaphelenchus xylophilus TaxID=6326 RepID=A0A1I7S8I8_BURXY|nr:unnamed protein product [Bursaphelenchus xylophilus]CAG9121119.1 unnamed protein product [Bursaphelenchus xylophilus]
MSLRLLSKSKPVVLLSRRWQMRLPTVPREVDFDRKYTFTERIREFLHFHVDMPTHIMFSEYSLRLFHKRDHLDHKQWQLIYNDLFISRTHAIFMFLLFCGGLGVAKCMADLKNYGEIQSASFRQMKKDLKRAGYFQYFFGITLANSIFWVFRIFAVRTRRIYQNVNNPNEYMLVRTLFGWIKNTIKVNRSEVQPTNRVIDRDHNPILAHAKMNLFGNVRVKNKAMIMEAHNFRDNQHYSYLFQHTNRVPFSGQASRATAPRGAARPF